MSNKEELKKEQVFADWLDGKSGDYHADESVLDEETLWQERKNTANTIKHYVAITGDETVPAWDRSSGFESDKAAFWQWRGLPALSMAFSIFAVALVLFKVELIIQEQGVLLSFAGKNTQLQEQKLARLVDERLQSFAQEQQVVLANYAADIKVKQQDNNLQLASYIMAASDKSEKKILATLFNILMPNVKMKFWNKILSIKSLKGQLNTIKCINEIVLMVLD